MNMVQNYAARLKIPVKGDSFKTLFLPCGELFSHGYVRVVIGGRGPYVELQRAQILAELKLPEIPHYYYVEHRTEKDDVKIYEQVRTVNYADYVLGLYYVSPFDLRLADCSAVIAPRQKRQGELFGGGR